MQGELQPLPPNTLGHQLDLMPSRGLVHPPGNPKRILPLARCRVLDRTAYVDSIAVELHAVDFLSRKRSHRASKDVKPLNQFIKRHARSFRHEASRDSPSCQRTLSLCHSRALSPSSLNHFAIASRDSLRY